MSGLKFDGLIIEGCGIGMSVPEGANIEMTNAQFRFNKIGIEVRDTPDTRKLFEEILEAVRAKQEPNTIKDRFAKRLYDFGIDWERHLNNSASLATVVQLFQPIWTQFGMQT